MEVHLRITGSGASATTLVSTAEETIKGRLGNAVYGADESTLEGVVVDVLQRVNSSLATAESCTGGMLGQRITSVPGSGDVYLGGFITYSNELKARALGVARSDLAKFGAVSEPVARQMSDSESALRESPDQGVETVINLSGWFTYRCRAHEEQRLGVRSFLATEN
jgi:nicotinamide-nucleotide amidase